MAAARTPVAGFTLVEVVVSLAVLSLIMLATVTALRTFGNTQASAERLIERVDEIRSVSGFLRDGLEAAVVAPDAGGGRLALGPGSAVRIPPYFKGNSQSLEWKAPLMFGESYGGVFLLRVGREDDRLVLRWRPPNDTDRDDADWNEAPSRVLLTGLEELQAAYRPEFDLPWQEEWSEEGSPALVRLGIRAGGRYWPELVLRVQR
jgi:general secretion pathway protein J